jgi:hypothetical protein
MIVQQGLQEIELQELTTENISSRRGKGGNLPKPVRITHTGFHVRDNGLRLPFLADTA